MDQLISAWLLWSDGKLPDSYLLWNVELLWWARYGKILQAIGVISIIIEIIGEKRIKIASEKVIYFLKNKKISSIKKIINNTPEIEISGFKEYNHKKKSIIILVSLYVIYNTTIYIFHVNNIDAMSNIFLIIIIILFYSPVYVILVWSSFYIINFLITLFYAVLAFFLWFFNKIVINFFLYVFAHKNPRLIYNIFILLCFIVGIHFDFLSS